MKDTEAERAISRTTRRRFLKTTAATAVSATALSAATGTAMAGGSSAEDADAPSDYPRISTRDHFDDDANLINGETTYSYDQKGDWSALNDEPLTLFVHGWGVDQPSSLDAAYECQLALQQNGYGNDVAAYTWDSDKGDSVDNGWSDAKNIAERNGEKLANFITTWNNYIGTKIRLIGHSLGARVSAETLVSLVDDFGKTNALDSVSLIGGAIDDQSPSQDGTYGNYIWDGTVEFHNYYNNDDQVLDDIYQTREFDGAVGEHGLQGEPEDNYFGHDVTDIVDKHGDYYKRDIGCVPQILSEF